MKPFFIEFLSPCRIAYKYPGVTESLSFRQLTEISKWQVHRACDQSSHITLGTQAEFQAHLFAIGVGFELVGGVVQNQ